MGGEISGANGDKDHRDIGPKRFGFSAGRVAGDQRRRPLLADYSWQWDKTREGLVPVALSNSWKIANCVNTNDEITGKSRFRVREVKGLSSCPEVVYHTYKYHTPFVYAFISSVRAGISYLYNISLPFYILQSCRDTERYDGVIITPRRVAISGKRSLGIKTR